MADLESSTPNVASAKKVVDTTEVGAGDANNVSVGELTQAIANINIMNESAGEGLKDTEPSLQTMSPVKLEDTEPSSPAKLLTESRVVESRIEKEATRPPVVSDMEIRITPPPISETSYVSADVATLMCDIADTTEVPVDVRESVPELPLVPQPEVCWQPSDESIQSHTIDELVFSGVVAAAPLNDTPMVPDIPEVPQEPVIPQVPQTPVIAGLPEELVVPEVPEEPVIPEVPEEPVIAEVPQEPVIAEVPQEPIIGELPQAPVKVLEEPVIAEVPEEPLVSVTQVVEKAVDLPTPETVAMPIMTTPCLTKVESTPPTVVDDQVHQIKYITWGSTRYPVVTQNENGPCPLVAIVNVLLLKGQVHLPDDIQIVTGEQLVEHVGDCVLRLAPQEMPERVRADYEHNVCDAIPMLNKLMTGLDVNVRFTGVGDFEYTKECIVFDLLGLPLYHGWLIDPTDMQTVNAVGNKTYNQLVEAIISDRTDVDPNKVAKAAACESFLESSATQLTPHGLEMLAKQMNNDEMAVFFRNNHFSTLIKNKDELRLLVTDLGFLKEENVVWETLSNVQNDSVFLDSQFKFVPHKGQNSPDTQIDQDYLVALSLDQDNQAEAGAQAPAPEEVTSPTQMTPGSCDPQLDAQLAWQLQQEENRGAQDGGGEPPAEGQQSPERQGPSPTKEEKKKCCIL